METTKKSKKVGFEFSFDLDSKVSIYVPSTYDVNNKTDNKEQVLRVIGELSDLFGGATATHAFGGWRCADGSIVTEEVTIVYSFCYKSNLREHIGDIIAICKRLKNDMKQEAISLEINGRLAFI